MNTAFSTALSGLNADSVAIDVVGNDLANLNTTGYKANELEFYNLMSQSIGAAGNSGQLGLGVAPPSALPVYSQGTLLTTNGPLDAAIQGDGFFVVNNQNNQQLYTRDGSFQLTANGELVTGTGDAVQGWSAVNGVVNPNGPVGNISVPLGATIAATPTTTMNLALNLDSQTSTSGTPTTFSAPVQVVDSLGQTHDLTATFTNTGTNTWSYSLTLPASDLASGASTTVASGNLTFNSSGNLTSPAATAGAVPVNIAGLSDGAANMSINWNLYDSSGNASITQYAEASAVAGTTQNGYTAGQISNVSLQNGGTLVASYTNGQQVTVAQLALGSIANPDSLTEVGDNNLQASASSGAVTLGAAGTGPRGTITAGALESSTVDITQEFTNILTFQRSYQANSRVISAEDQLLQDTVNLIHQ
jgi:flagellar hook protein FlgE